MGQVIKCNFNLFKEGREYTGHHRNYILESAVNMCYAGPTREMLKLREAVGYLGHGRRELAGRLQLPEVSSIKLPDGSSILTENIPSNVTVAFEVSKDGTVNHEQEILETAPGQVVSALNAGKVGGFSWACGGTDGGSMGATKLSGFHGFDYVINPGFATNRGYILESAGNGLILESVCKATGMSDGEVEKWLKSWVAGAVLENAGLQSQLESAATYEDLLREESEAKALLLESAKGELAALTGAQEARKKLILECAAKSVIAIPAKVVDSILSMANENDFNELIGFFESAQRVDISGLPIGANKKIVIPSKTLVTEVVEYGTAAAGYDFSERKF